MTLFMIIMFALISGLNTFSRTMITSFKSKRVYPLKEVRFHFSNKNNPEDDRINSNKRQSTSSTTSDPFPTRTLIEDVPSIWKISHQTPVFFIGSCFSSHISQKMKELKFSVNANPHGILFNPISIARCIHNILNGYEYQSEDLFLDHHPDRPLYHSYDHHSDYDGFQKEEVLQKINHDIAIAHSQLKTCKVLFITFGTAKVYSLLNHTTKQEEEEEEVADEEETRKTGRKQERVVANCHKQPSKLFENRLLSSEEIVKVYQPIIQQLQSFNPQLQIVFTVSPIRHTRDGIITNSLSKSTLLYSIHQLISQQQQQQQQQQHPKKHPSVSYFPSYEYMIDDLRDYRYYEADLIHPNEQAITYIFHFFQKKYFSNETLQIIPEIFKLFQHLSHRSKDKQSKLYKHSLQFALEKINELEGKYSLNYQIERKQIENEIAATESTHR